MQRYAMSYEMKQFIALHCASLRCGAVRCATHDTTLRRTTDDMTRCDMIRYKGMSISIVGIDIKLASVSTPISQPTPVYVAMPTSIAVQRTSIRCC